MHIHHPNGKRVQSRRKSAIATSMTISTGFPEQILNLQRVAGNSFVSALAKRERKSVQRAPAASSVISGHGRFSDSNLLPANPDKPRDRNKTPYFEVPDGVQIVMYAPAGASLENEAAKRIESGGQITAEDLELVSPTNKRGPMPSGYPKTFGPKEKVINFGITPIASQHLSEGATTVEASTTLSNEVARRATEHREQNPDGGMLTLHYACCGSGFSDHRDAQDAFPYRGYSVMLKIQPDSDSEQPAKRSKR